MDTLTLVVSTLVSINTGIYMWMLANGDGRGWYGSLMSQGLWWTLIFVTQAWGLVPLSGWLTYVAIRGLRRHRRGDG